MKILSMFCPIFVICLMGDHVVCAVEIETLTSSSFKSISEEIDKLVKSDNDAELFEKMSQRISELVVPDKGDVSEESSKLRRQKLELSLQLFTAISSQADPTFDPADRPFLNVSIPGVLSGSKPESVIDPVLREKYRAVHEKNRKKLKTYKFQSKMQELRAYVLKHQIFVAIHSCFPGDDKDTQEELAEFLTEAVKTEAVRVALIKELKELNDKYEIHSDVVVPKPKKENGL